MIQEKEFSVNNFLKLRLNRQLNSFGQHYTTNIYVGGKHFRQCKFLLLNIPIDKISLFDEIDSIDEAAEKLDKSQEPIKGYKQKVPPEVEFWGHCSNLQVWYENNYDTRLLHSNLAFPLLKRLVDEGDSVAKQVFKEEIAKRLASGYMPVINYLINQKFLRYLNHQDILSALLSPKEAEVIIELEQLINSKFKIKFEIQENEPVYIIPRKKHVKLIYLDNCHLETVPREIKDLKFIEDISLASNSIAEVPDWLFKLKNLNYINLAGNKLKDIPLTQELAKTKYLDISCNPIKNLAKIIEYYKNINNFII